MATGLADLMPGIISGYGGGTWNADGSMAMPVDGLSGILQQQTMQPLQQQIPQVTPPRQGAFDKGGDGWKIIGIIGDAMQGFSGREGSFANAMQQQTELETQGRQKLAEMLQQQQQRQAEREQALADQKALIDYRAKNTPDTFGRALTGAGIDPNSEEARGLYRKRAEMLTNPVQLVPDGMGGYQAVRPNEAGGGAPSGLQPGYTEDGYTFMGGDPGDPSNWTQGGAASNGGGMFP